MFSVVPLVLPSPSFYAASQSSKGCTSLALCPCSCTLMTSSFSQLFIITLLKLVGKGYGYIARAILLEGFAM